MLVLGRSYLIQGEAQPEYNFLKHSFPCFKIIIKVMFFIYHSTINTIITATTTMGTIIYVFSFKHKMSWAILAF